MESGEPSENRVRVGEMGEYRPSSSIPMMESTSPLLDPLREAWSDLRLIPDGEVGLEGFDFFPPMLRYGTKVLNLPLFLDFELDSPLSST
jgi:hypothetical protein